MPIQHKTIQAFCAENWTIPDYLKTPFVIDSETIASNRWALIAVNGAMQGAEVIDQEWEADARRALQALKSLVNQVQPEQWRPLSDFIRPDMAPEHCRTCLACKGVGFFFIRDCLRCAGNGCGHCKDKGFTQHTCDAAHPDALRCHNCGGLGRVRKDRTTYYTLATHQSIPDLHLQPWLMDLWADVPGVHYAPPEHNPGYHGLGSGWGHVPIRWAGGWGAISPCAV